MLRKPFKARVLWGLPLLLAILVVAAACAAAETPAAEVRIVEKEVIREIEVPVIVEREVIKRVEVPVIVEKEVIKEVPVIKEVIVEKEVIREVRVEVPVIVEKEVIREVEVAVVVEKQVVVVKEVMVAAMGPRTGGGIINYKYGDKPSSFSEAPEFAALVKQGKLPPVEERIPEDPNVIEGTDGIGRYSSMYHFLHGEGDTGYEGFWHDAFVVKTMDGKEIVPHVSKGWTISPDSKTYTFSLRRGMKWSDGTPFTADDYEFGWNDIMANTDMYKTPSRVYQFDGVLGEFTKIDDYTVRYTFPVTYPTFLNNLEWQGWGTGRNGYFIYAPKHYLKQFHPSYANKAELDKKISDAGLDQWHQLFRKKSDWLRNLDSPKNNPWLTTQVFGSRLWKMEHNPYFMSVDTAGQQLPYIREKVGVGVADNEILQLKFMAGESDYGERGVDPAKVTMFLVNAEKQGYEVIFRPRENSYFALFNLTYDKDPEIRKWLQNKDFRRAVSLSMNREKAHSVVTNTLGEVRQSVPPSWLPYYMGPEWDKKNTEYDPAEANAILDSLGLKARDADGYRLRSDGQGTLEIHVFGAGARVPDLGAMAEIMGEDLAEVGIKAHVDTKPGSTWASKNDAQITFAGFYGANPWRWGYIPRQKNHSQAPLIGNWIVSKGAEGLDPNSNPVYRPLARSIELWEKGQTMSVAERVPLTREIVEIYVDNYYLSGMIGNVPSVVLLNKKIRGVPLGPNIGQNLRELYWFTGDHTH